jgi:hypothetical protein
MKTTLSFACVTSTVLLAGSRHDTLAWTRLVLVIHSMSAGVTTDPPSQNGQEEGPDYCLPVEK